MIRGAASPSIVVMTILRERPARTAWAEWRVPAGLVLLSLVPVVAGAARVAQLAAGGPATAENARFVAAPIPVVLHIVGATVFCLLGAVQFAPRFRRRHRRWHRIAGRIALPCGLVAALTGLWMTLFYPFAPGDGPLLAAFRLIAGSAMAYSLIAGYVAIRRRDFTGHRRWIVRGYALGLGAGTQVFTLVPWLLLAGVPGEVTRALLMAAGWLINVAVAEWAIRRHNPLRR
jgi:uncharacterized membrane protein